MAQQQAENKMSLTSLPYKLIYKLKLFTLLADVILIGDTPEVMNKKKIPDNSSVVTQIKYSISFTCELCCVIIS